jgi:gliding motility-associated-like protein
MSLLRIPVISANARRFLFVFILISQFVNAQLGDFTLAVMATNESCTANGTLTFNVQNATAGATMLYTVFHLPDATTPIAVLSANTVTGLVAGNYRVVATQSLGSQSASKQQDVTIVRTIVNLDYVLTGIKEVCGNDGRILVNVTNGIGVSFEIISGPVIRPLQPSYAFDNLPGGTYVVRVFDACGEGVARTFTLESATAALTINYLITSMVDCATLDIDGYLVSGTGGVIKYPITIQATVTPNGGGISYNFAVTHGSGLATDTHYSFTLPIGDYTADVIVTDGCGNVYNANDLAIATPSMSIYPSILFEEEGCNNYSFHISASHEVHPVTIAFLTSPAGFNPSTFNAQHPGPFNTENIIYYNPSVPLPAGAYTIQMTDACGRTATRSVTVTYSTTPGAVFFTSSPGCGPGFGSLNVDGHDDLIGGQLISAPLGYPYPLPQNLASYVFEGEIYMNNLPPGTYVFTTIDACNLPRTVTGTVVGYQSGATTVNITEHCNSFDLYFANTSNARFPLYWLQKFNPVTNLWGHPTTGYAGSQTEFSQNTAIYINVGQINYNIQSSGQFRIMKAIAVFSNGSIPPPACSEQISTFEYKIGPRINHVYSIGCDNGTFDAIVDASGYPPLAYRITSKNGQPFFVNNGVSNIFVGLASAIYNFQIEDNCGNILNSLLDVSNPYLFSIQPTSLCAGQSATLSVPAFSFLTYQWWKEGSPGNILSMTNALSFPAFNAVADAGIYHITINYPNQSSCIDLVLDFEISPVLSNPQAGENGAATYCGPNGTIDLFTLLSGTYSDFGQWEEVTNSGALSGNLWNSVLVPPGNYQFKYKVTGLCNAFDESVVDIAIKPLPQAPEASVEQPACSNGQLQLLSTEVPNATYAWTGPNGFASTEQNPFIDNPTVAYTGIYTVNALFDGCPSIPSSVEVTVQPTPQFTLASSCSGSAFILSVISLDNSLNADDVSISWTGPENFSATGNPIIITGKPTGTYEVTVSGAEGCSEISQIEVPNTLCEIPKGVSPNADDANDTFDLAGFDVKHVKIFNRYGMVVFEQENYIDQWHGQDYLGHELPSSTYYYLVHLMSGETKSGWVYLLRD